MNIFRTTKAKKALEDVVISVDAQLQLHAGLLSSAGCGEAVKELMEPKLQLLVQFYHSPQVLCCNLCDCLSSLSGMAIPLMHTIFTP